MATKKYEGMRIMSLEGSVLYKNEGFTAIKDGKPDPQAFRGILDESLDTLKLAEVYARCEDEIGYPYLDGKKRFCRAVVNLSFNRAVKVIKDNRSSKTGFTIEVIVVNITFRETLSQKILDLKILQVFIETLLIFRRN